MWGWGRETRAIEKAGALLRDALHHALPSDEAARVERREIDKRWARSIHVSHCEARKLCEFAVFVHLRIASSHYQALLCVLDFARRDDTQAASTSSKHL